MMESLLSKQDQVEAFHIFFIKYTNHNPASALHISNSFNCYGSIGGCFVGLVDLATKTALVNG
jgi:hypothetical protein